MKINIKYLSLLCFALPIVTVIISYIISIKLSLVEACIPNLQGCTSISRVGRYAPVSYFFKTLMFAYSVILIIYWNKNYNLLKKYKIKNIKLTYWLGIFSVIFFLLYIIFLGEGDYYRFFRKVGIYIFIFFLVISQFMLTKKYIDLKKNIINSKYLKIKIFLSNFLLYFGLMMIPLMLLKIDQFPEIKNIISWNYFILLQFYFLLTSLTLKKTNF